MSVQRNSWGDPIINPSSSSASGGGDQWNDQALSSSSSTTAATSSSSSPDMHRNASGNTRGASRLDMTPDQKRTAIATARTDSDSWPGMTPYDLHLGFVKASVFLSWVIMPTIMTVPLALVAYRRRKPPLPFGQVAFRTSGLAFAVFTFAPFLATRVEKYKLSQLGEVRPPNQVQDLLRDKAAWDMEMMKQKKEMPRPSIWASKEARNMAEKMGLDGLVNSTRRPQGEQSEFNQDEMPDFDLESGSASGSASQSVEAPKSTTPSPSTWNSGVGARSVFKLPQSKDDSKSGGSSTSPPQPPPSSSADPFEMGGSSSSPPSSGPRRFGSGSEAGSGGNSSSSSSSSRWAEIRAKKAAEGAGQEN